MTFNTFTVGIRKTAIYAHFAQTLSMVNSQLTEVKCSS